MGMHYVCILLVFSLDTQQSKTSDKLRHSRRMPLIHVYITIDNGFGLNPTEPNRETVA